MDKRNYGIDLIKIISICGMIALHTQRSLQTGICYNPILYYLGRFCMPAFFMVNGYLILSKEDFTKQYYIKKILNMVRLLVLWAGVNALYFAFVKDQFSIKEMIWNGGKSFFAHGIIPFWFIFTFAIIYTILLFSFNTIKKNIAKIVIALGCCCVIVDLVSMFNIFHNGGYFIQSNISQRYRLWTWLFYFCLGYQIKDYKPKTKTYVQIGGVLLTSAIAIIYQYFLCDVYLNKINSEYCYDNIIVMIWVITIFVFISNLYIPQKYGSIISSISISSFGVFLLHGYFIDCFDLTNIVNNSTESFILWVGLIVGCYVLSAVISKIPKVNIILKY